MRVSTFVPLLIGLAAGVFAVYVGLAKIREAQQAAPVAETSIVIAAAEIPYAKQISAEMLTAVKGNFPMRDGFDAAEKIVGRVTSNRIIPGTPISERMLAPAGTSEGAQYQLPSGVFPIPVNVKATEAKNLEPGNRVAVLYTPLAGSARTPGDLMTAKVVLQSVEVFRVGDRGPGGSSAEPVSQDEASRGPRQTVSVGAGRDVNVELLVPADKLGLMTAVTRSGGGVTLVLRRQGDESPLDLPELLEAVPVADTGTTAPVETEPAPVIVPPQPEFDVVKVNMGGVLTDVKIEKPADDEKKDTRAEAPQGSKRDDKSQ